MALVDFNLYRLVPGSNMLEQVNAAGPVTIEDAPGGTQLTNPQLAEAVARAWLDSLGTTEPDEDAERQRRTGRFQAVRTSRLLRLEIRADRVYTITAT